ncbi:peptidoglycan DD-metalloendopeptidase family protein [Mucilaginibacter arboris]|uniref:Peptidoglycan DD-metalloendopeptidase family protein n=1 Tax=Mucilaginibacter arboris TaxID=2682090 RepID=A0A7K1SSA3_9SPHI|nr:peptidoglycan DD-metalloendopeptidase family protein [Mucilaginibacter arboris]MVN20196.1 peptidoglycan DD-metalloendopeptidase family protein [Mucilaginibacter arboris]
MLLKKHQQFAGLLQKHGQEIGKVVDFNPAKDRLFPFDFTASNTALSAETVADTNTFSDYVTSTLQQNHCRYGIGGYFEHRTLYARSTHFNTSDEARRLHLGIDIWAEAGTPVYASFTGKIHSYADNDHFGDYGPTIILEHNFYGLTFFALYGHLNREALKGLYPGKLIQKNEEIARFGTSEENGSWPPHLHYQLMFDMEGNEGDYPGVCKLSEKEKYLQNTPDPNLILRFPVQR